VLTGILKDARCLLFKVQDLEMLEGRKLIILCMIDMKLIPDNFFNHTVKRNNVRDRVFLSKTTNRVFKIQTNDIEETCYQKIKQTQTAP
jgi:hypothetical protein